MYTRFRILTSSIIFFILFIHSLFLFLFPLLGNSPSSVPYLTCLQIIVSPTSWREELACQSPALHSLLWIQTSRMLDITSSRSMGFRRSSLARVLDDLASKENRVLIWSEMIWIYWLLPFLFLIAPYIWISCAMSRSSDKNIPASSLQPCKWKGSDLIT